MSKESAVEWLKSNKRRVAVSVAVATLFSVGSLADKLSASYDSGRLSFVYTEGRNPISCPDGRVVNSQFLARQLIVHLNPPSIEKPPPTSAAFPPAKACGRS